MADVLATSPQQTLRREPLRSETALRGAGMFYIIHGALRLLTFMWIGKP